ncbi:MAG: hypothetical protein JRJ84_11270 [Deltaproteobacteria bacterium]|nr:hypothetical protein [Deltaproteobacteria bacterium]
MLTPEPPKPMVVGLGRQAWVHIGLSAVATAMWPIAFTLIAIASRLELDHTTTADKALGWLLGITLLGSLFLAVLLPFFCFPRSFVMISLYRRLPVERRDGVRPLLFYAGVIGLLTPILPIVMVLLFLGTCLIG